MLHALIVFASAFVTVFALGFQSLNVNGGHYVAAFLTSAVIGVANLFLFKLLPSANSPSEIAAYLIGGPLAIVSAMWVHRNVVTKWRNARVNQ